MSIHLSLLLVMLPRLVEKTIYQFAVSTMQMNSAMGGSVMGLTDKDGNSTG